MGCFIEAVGYHSRRDHRIVLISSALKTLVKRISTRGACNLRARVAVERKEIENCRASLRGLATPECASSAAA